MKELTWDETDWDFAARIRSKAMQVDGSEREKDEALHLFLVEWGYACRWPKSEAP